MKTNLLSLFIILLLAISCKDSNNNASVKDEPKTSTTKNEPKTLTTKEALINEGWSQLGTVSVYNDNGDECYVFYTVFYKDEHYAAIDSSHENLIGCPRYSVTKGNYRICNKIYSGRISCYGRYLYFNF